MGIFGFFSSIADGIRNGFEKVKDKVEEIVDNVKGFFGDLSYNKKDVNSRVDVDRALAEFREKLEPYAYEAEDECMDNMSKMFDELNSLINEKFPDLAEMVDTEKMKAQKKLSGYIMKYVKLKLSQNDEQIRKVLEMQPGDSKGQAMKVQARRVVGEAKNEFNILLKKHTQIILDEVSERINIRINDQEERLDKKITELQELEKEMKKGAVDVERKINACSPAIEASSCIIDLLQTSLTSNV